MPTGLICTRCSPLRVASDAIHDARSICMREYATAPEVTVYGDPAFTFPYVPSHLHHMTFELVRGMLLGHPQLKLCRQICLDTRSCAHGCCILQWPQVAEPPRASAHAPGGMHVHAWVLGTGAW